MTRTRAVFHFLFGCIKIAVVGSRVYYAWLTALFLLIALGAWAYARQLEEGLVVTALRDPVSWGFYIGNFTFLVGVAAAAVILVIPAYIYNWKPIKEIVILGELMAIAALAMCMLFVLVDMGRPDRLLHIIPIIGSINLPSSLLGWDVVVLNLYFFLNLGVVTYLLWSIYRRREPNPYVFTPLVLFSIPVAVGIHTVTAFVYNGLPGRPFWNASILAPKFLASAFCSGPALMLILLQVLRKFFKLDLKIEAIWKIAELMAYAMFINLFFLFAEIFKEAYSDTHHLLHVKYLYFGIEGHNALIGWAWTSVVCSVAAFFLFLVPATRKNVITLNLGCVLIWCGVYIEKGIGLVVPGYTPSTLGEIYEYSPTMTEFQVAFGIFGVGALVFTFLSRVAIALTAGGFGLRTPLELGEPTGNAVGG
ncbi:MAG: sulfate reduction electron transfer complex DsrMKJOP subunit DsrP [Planctomycetota bacterium]|jgi:molybdopterin-containing oxidoreductase family membrane subunit